MPPSYASAITEKPAAVAHLDRRWSAERKPRQEGRFWHHVRAAASCNYQRLATHRYRATAEQDRTRNPMAESPSTLGSKHPVARVRLAFQHLSTSPVDATEQLHCALQCRSPTTLRAETDATGIALAGCYCHGHTRVRMHSHPRKRVPCS